MFAAPDDDAAGRGRFIPDDYAAMMLSVPCPNLAEESGNSQCATADPLPNVPSKPESPMMRGRLGNSR